MVLRPDEEANLKEIERDKRFRSTLSHAGAAGIGLATGLGASSLGTRLLPFLSEHIPLNLAMKGINKISPKLGKFLKDGQSMGLNVKEGLDFIKDKIGSKEQRNIIEQYSPELHNFLKQEIGQGRAPIEAAALATLPKSGRDFTKAIKQLEKDHKTSFQQIVQSIFGTAQQSQQQMPQQMQPEAPQQAQTAQQGAGPGQQANTDQALMAALEKILQM
jgi:alkylated DNA nucleotide flippase Atl1